MPKQAKGLGEVENSGAVVSRLVRNKVGEMRRRDEENCVHEEIMLVRILNKSRQINGRTYLEG